MQLPDQHCDVDEEPGIPFIRALLDLRVALDELQQRMLTFHSPTPNHLAVCVTTPAGRRPAAPRGGANL